MGIIAALSYFFPGQAGGDERTDTHVVGSVT